MAKTNRDQTKVAAGLIFHSALTYGDEPIEYVAEFLKRAEEAVGKIGAGHPPDGQFLADLHVALIALNIAIEGRQGALKVVFKPRTAGRPVDRLAIARRRHAAIRTVKNMVASGIKQEAAVATAMEQTGLSRSAVMRYLRADRAIEARLRNLSART